MSLHEPTPEEKEKAEKLKNEGISKRVLKHTASKGVGYSGLFYGCKILCFKGKKVFSVVILAISELYLQVPSVLQR